METTVSAYEFGVFGSISRSERKVLACAIVDRIADFGLSLGDQVAIHDGASVARRDKAAAFVAVYFGGSTHVDVDIMTQLVGVRAPIVPTIGPTGSVKKDIPEILQALNVLHRRDDDPEMTELTSALLEAAGLLRRQRRVFVSYRRNESRAAAMQLHDSLTARGFDVFLDTHGVRPGDPFQDVLWHRLCDSDLIVMLETPGYFHSKWTRYEFGRALAKEIHILRLVWPGHQPNRQTGMATTIYLNPGDLTSADGPIVGHRADEIAHAVERLRGRSIASRYRSITSRLRSDVKKLEGMVEGVGPYRAITVRLPDGRRILVYPVVGIPTAEILNDIADRAHLSPEGDTSVVLAYDDIGIRESWINHLDWLNKNITEVQMIKVSEAAWSLAAWEN